MLPKLEKAKQIRASMALEAQNIAPETSLVEESVRVSLRYMQFCSQQNFL